MTRVSLKLFFFHIRCGGTIPKRAHQILCNNAFMAFFVCFFNFCCVLKPTDRTQDHITNFQQASSETFRAAVDYNYVHLLSSSKFPPGLCLYRPCKNVKYVWMLKKKFFILSGFFFSMLVLVGNLGRSQSPNTQTSQPPQEGRRSNLQEYWLLWFLLFIY